MAEATFTPGPWSYEPDERTYNGVDEIAGWNIFSSSGEVVGCEGILCDGEANARLIAAAPTMFEFIERRASAGDVDAQKILEAIYASR